jgi:hypothetical protein
VTHKGSERNGDRMDELEDVRRVIAVLQALSDRIEDMLTPRPASARTAQLIAWTTQLKADIKEAKAGAERRRRQGRNSRADDQFESAVSRAVAEFRMRVDTDPSRALWSAQLRDVQAEFVDFMKRLRSEFPGA